jgi:hypothetical protein
VRPPVTAGKIASAMYIETKYPPLAPNEGSVLSLIAERSLYSPNVPTFPEPPDVLELELSNAV